MICDRTLDDDFCFLGCEVSRISATSEDGGSANDSPSCDDGVSDFPFSSSSSVLLCSIRSSSMCSSFSGDGVGIIDSLLGSFASSALEGVRDPSALDGAREADFETGFGGDLDRDGDREGGFGKGPFGGSEGKASEIGGTCSESRSCGSSLKETLGCGGASSGGGCPGIKVN
jgi:hypothetical protein